jgi:hypothetical protein
MWDYNINKYTDDSATFLMLPWRLGFSFSMYYLFGRSAWPSNAGLSRGLTFTAYIETILVAPYSGLYTFYLNSDDQSYLYGRLLEPYLNNVNASEEDGETLLAYQNYWASPNEFFVYDSQISDSVYLPRGQKYELRLKTVSDVMMRYCKCLSIAGVAGTYGEVILFGR